MKLWLDDRRPAPHGWTRAYTVAEDGLRLPAELDLLLSHIPPFGVLDADKRGVTHGSKTLLAEIGRTRPAITICGHVHAARGRYTFPWGGHVYNVAAVDEFPQPHSDAVVCIALPST